MSISERIKSLCKEKGTNFSKVEKELGFSNGSLANSENISAVRLEKVADYFGVSMDYLMRGTESQDWMMLGNDFQVLMTTKEAIPNDEWKKIMEYAEMVRRINDEVH